MSLSTQELDLSGLPNQKYLNEKTQKKQFWVLFFIEMWERYAFYGFQTLFMLFITHEKLPQNQAYLVFGIFTALLWMMPTVGGWLADKFFGLQRSLLIGATIFAFGYLILSMSTNMESIYIALSIIATGNGFFKPIPSAMISNIYNNNPLKAKSAFTLYYMSIQIGGLTAIFISPLLATYTSFSLAFIMSTVGMIIGVSNYALKYKIMSSVCNNSDHKKLSFKLSSFIILALIIQSTVCFALLNMLDISFYLILTVGIIVFLILFKKAFSYKCKTTTFKQIVGLILIIESIAFFIVYNQMFSTFMLFAKSNLNLNFLGFQFSPGNIVLFDGFGVLLLSPVVIQVYKLLEKKGINTTIPDKFAAGQFFAGLSVLLLAGICILFANNGELNFLWMAVSFAVFTIGEILVSALGLAMISLYFPKKMIGFGMGVWFLSMAIGGVLTGKVAELFAVIPATASKLESMHLYTNYFINLGIISIIIGFIYFIIAFVIKKIASHKQINIS